MTDFFRERFTINARFCANMAFILFFGYRAWYGILRLSRSRITILLSIILVYAFVVAAARLSRRKNSEVLAGASLILICVLIFAVTWFFHPEYSDWFFRNEDYRLISSVFYPTGGIFAFLFIYMADDPEEMRRNMRIVAFMMLLFAIYQLIPVIRVGHWDTAAKTGARTNTSSYSLGFGYRTILCPMVFWNEFRHSRRPLYLALTGATLLMVLFFGGRGCILAFVLYLAFRYLAAHGIRNRRSLLVIAFFAILAVLWSTGLLAKGLTVFAGALGGLGSSRTVAKILNGSFLEDGARTRIWKLAIGMISTGGIFGRGAYGDRLVIGEFYSWGYSHNVFLEMMVDFGVFGALFLIVLIAGIIWFLKVMDKKWKEMFLIFLGLSCQLLVSDSFWYNTAFWAVLAFLVKNRRRLLSLQARYAASGLSDLWHQQVLYLRQNRE